MNPGILKIDPEINHYPTDPILFAQKIIGENQNRYICERSLISFLCESAKDKCKDEKDLLDHIYYLLSDVSAHDVVDMVYRYREKGTYLMANEFMASPMYIKNDACKNVCRYIADIRAKDHPV